MLQKEMAINLLKSFLALLNLLLSVMYEEEVEKRDASARDSLIFSAMQPVRFSFACHVSCKVKYFGKVANV